MGSTSQFRRFKTNPVEIAIFAVVTILFGHSVWRLFHESANYKPNALTSMSSNPLTEGRAPASVHTGEVGAGALNMLTKLMGAATASQPATTSVQSPLASIEFRCKDMSATDTGAQKIRLIGASCAPLVANPTARQPASVTSTPTEAASATEVAEGLPSETRIYNQANRFAATVFQDSSTRRFTTDYIPLVSGANPIRIQFIYKGGQSYSQDFVVTRQ